MQHLLLPLVFVASAWLVRRARRLPARGALLACLAVALGCIALAVAIQSRHPTLGHANRIDTVFGAVLPAAQDPVALRERLGLEPACDELVHTNWYLRRGRDALAECPSIAAVGPGRLARVLATEPRTLAVAFARGLGMSTPWRIPYVGELAGGHHARMAPGALGLHASIADALAPRGFRFHAVLWLLPVLLGLSAALRLAFPPRRPQEIALAFDALLATCGAIVALGWASSVLGDGYSELARHLHLAANAALAAWLLALARLFADRRALPLRALGFAPRWESPSASGTRRCACRWRWACSTSRWTSASKATCWRSRAGCCRRCRWRASSCASATASRSNCRPHRTRWWRGSIRSRAARRCGASPRASSRRGHPAARACR